MDPDELSKDASCSLINEAHISQPACTAVQLALTDLLRSWNVLPTAVAGHSSGEIGAAYAAGILPLKSCMAIAYYRGMVTTLLKKKYPNLKGSMMAVGCSKEEVGPLIARLTAKEVKIACYNSPSSLTISGDEPAIDELHDIMEETQIFNRKLQVEMAYHSHHMELVAKDYLGCLQGLDEPKLTDVQFHSSLLGSLVDGTKLQASYWVDNLTQSVRFSEALTSMCQPIDGFKTGVNMLIEIGPHSALAGPVKQILKACGANAMKIPYTSALVRKKNAVETGLDLASTLFTKGATLSMGAVNLPPVNKAPALLVDMPRYPWNHQTKYWHESRVMQKHKGRSVPRNDILGTLANYSNDLEPTWRNILRVDDLPWLRHHKIQSLILFPMSGFISMAIQAASQRAASRDIQYEKFEIRDICVHTPLMVTDDEVEITLQLRPHQEGTLLSSDIWDEFRVHSWVANKGWTEHCKGLISVESKNSISVLLPTTSQVSTENQLPLDKDKIYESLADLGVSYGPSFQGMNNCYANHNSSSADIITVDTAQEMPKEYQTDSVIHPAILEQLIEMYWPILGAGRVSIDTVYLPSSIRRISISHSVTNLTKTPGDCLRASCTGLRPVLHPRPVQMSMTATSQDAPLEPVIMIEDLTITPIIERDTELDNEIHRELCYKLDWEPIFESSNSSSSATSIEPSGHSNGVKAETNGTTNGLSNGTPELPDEPIVIICGSSGEQQLLATRLADVLAHETGKIPQIEALDAVETSGKICLFLSEIDGPLLSTLTPKQFISLQRILTNSEGILWTVRGAYVGATNPDANMVTGLSRSIRSETLLKFATLDLDSTSTSNPDLTVASILIVLKAVFGSKAGENCELEFMERNGQFFTPRIINDTDMNEYVHKQTSKVSVLEPTLFSQDDRPLKLAIQIPGALETLHFVDQATDEPLAEDEIEILVKAIGMNDQDLCSVMGQLENFDFGSECSGTITRVGSKVQDFATGERVACVSAQGVYSSYTRTKASLAFKVDENMSFEAAASIPLAYCTANYGLIELSRLEKDETILIYGGASATGQASIAFAQSVGAQVSTVVTDVSTKEFLMNTFGLIDEQVTLCSIHPVRKGYFDVVLNCISTNADKFREVWESLNTFGRFVELAGNNFRLETCSSDNKSFMSVDILSLAHKRPKVMSRLISRVSKLLKSGKAVPLQTTSFSISDIEIAFKALQAGEFNGKLIVSPHQDDQVKARFPILSSINILTLCRLLRP